MATLALTTLGALQITLGGKPLTGFRSAKAQALLVYLAVEAAQPHTRDALMGLFWPDHSQETAQANLRQTLARLQSAIHNREVDTPFILVDREQVQLNPAAQCVLDCATFQAGLAACPQHGSQPDLVCHRCLEHHVQAVALYGGDFLAHFDCDSPEFDLWAAGVRARLHRMALDALQFLADAYEARGETGAALTYLDRQLALEPWREEAYRQQMQILARQGERSAALALYERCRAALAEELGAPPSPEMEALYQRIKGAAEVRPHHLPAQTTSFVGRERELAQLLHYLADPKRRLLTLVGPGGIGKTRLALQAAWSVAADQAGSFPQGVYFVSMVGATSANYLVTALADALDLSLTGLQEPEAQLLAHLRDRELLLIVDNFEHLVEAGVRLLNRILQSAPGVHILVTSRERLNLPEEWVVEVPGLAFPPPALDAAHISLEGLLAYSAIRLFVERAQQVAPAFSLVAGTAETLAVVRITRLLEGNPLALELAAAWAHMLPCSELAEELERNLDFLSATHRELPARHRSLRAVFDHSWRQLDPEDQAVLPRLTLFRGSFDRTAAARLAGASLLTLASLVNKSLIQVVTAGRYRLHELIRQFAAEKLADNERWDLRNAHAGYYTGWLASLDEDLHGPGQQRALERVQTEIENVRAAWLWSIAHSRVEWVRQATRSLYQFYFIRCWTDEATEMMRHAEAMLQEELGSATGERRAEIEATLAQVLAYLGNAHYSSSRLDQAEDTLLRCLALCSRHPSLAQVTAYAKQELALTYYAIGDYPQSRSLLRETLPLAQTLGLQNQQAHLQLALGVVELALGKPVEAQHYVQAALEVYEARGYQWGIAHTLRWQGLAALQAGDWAAAEAAFCRGLELCQAIGDQTGEAMALNDLAAVALAEGRLQECRAYLERSLAIALHDENHLLRSRVLKNFGCLLQREGRLAEAEEHLILGLRGAETAQSTQLVLDLLLELATLWEDMGRVQDAATLYAVVADHPAAVAAARRRALAHRRAGANGVAADPSRRLKEVLMRILQGQPLSA
ncbi:MAG TPA: BTAD domain-containing putative transcriptional regulator [Caldilineaceae bacterium]|nr:BTAD domain-containing putative transcriptional regulator [Caldilineaceae bacterium]